MIFKASKSFSNFTIFLKTLSSKQQCQYFVTRFLIWHFFLYWYASQWEQIFSFCRNDENVYTKNNSPNVLIFIQFMSKFRSSRRRVFRATISFFRCTFLFIEIDSELEIDVDSINWLNENVSNWNIRTNSSSINFSRFFFMKSISFFWFDCSIFCFVVRVAIRSNARLIERKTWIIVVDVFRLNDTIWNSTRDRIEFFFFFVSRRVSFLSKFFFKMLLLIVGMTCFKERLKVNTWVCIEFEFEKTFSYISTWLWFKRRLLTFLVLISIFFLFKMIARRTCLFEVLRTENTNKLSFIMTLNVCYNEKLIHEIAFVWIDRNYFAHQRYEFVTTQFSTSSSEFDITWFLHNSNAFDEIYNLM